MLHLLYILAFTTLAILAVGNLLRSLLTLGLESQRSLSATPMTNRYRSQVQAVPHPEFLDDSGNIVNEPLLVMRSMTVEDAREKLDALYNSSPGFTGDSRDEG